MASLLNQIVAAMNAVGGPIDVARLFAVFVGGVIVGAAIAWERQR